MLASEKRSLIRFLLIYLISTLMLFSLASYFFYTAAKKHILDQQRETLRYEAADIKSKLRILHESHTRQLVYPTYPMTHSAIYDLDKKYIFGSYPSAPDISALKSKDIMYYLSSVEPYYLGAAYLLVSRHLERGPIDELQKNILLFLCAAGIFFSILGYFLGRLFVAPMKESLERMNHFIQDTTHELNTPISTILTNIEMIETFGKHQENTAELKRIAIASKTLSRIYDDLTYLNLNHQYHRNVVLIDFSGLVAERIVYFFAMIESKHLKVIRNIQQNIMLHIDKNDALRLIDNLISNAIKYNRHKGVLEIILDAKQFTVKDTGIGMVKSDLQYIVQRFKRVNKSEGGFGIGLHIVQQVVESYGFMLHIDSEENKGTEVSVLWEK